MVTTNPAQLQAAPSLDLEALERLIEKLPACNCNIDSTPCGAEDDCRATISVRDAVPTLIARLREAEAKAAKLERRLHAVETQELRDAADRMQATNIMKLDEAYTEEKQERRRAEVRVAELEAEIEQHHAKATCMCGSYVSEHGIGDGHSPVSMYDYALEQSEARITELEAQLREAKVLAENAPLPASVEGARLRFIADTDRILARATTRETDDAK